MILRFHRPRYNVYVAVEDGARRFSVVVRRSAWGWVVDPSCQRRRHRYKNLWAWLRCADGVKAVSRQWAAEFIKSARS